MAWALVNTLGSIEDNLSFIQVKSYISCLEGLAREILLRYAVLI
jgi:hypothetical protein